MCYVCTCMHVYKMDAGRRKFLLHQPGSAGGVVTALSPLSMSSLSSATSSNDRGSAARVGDWLRTDIDWTVKYLTSDQARSSPFTIASRLSRTGDELLAPTTCTSAGSQRYRTRIFSVSSCVFVVIRTRWSPQTRQD